MRGSEEGGALGDAHERRKKKKRGRRRSPFFSSRDRDKLSSVREKIYAAKSITHKNMLLVVRLTLARCWEGMGNRDRLFPLSLSLVVQLSMGNRGTGF
jgi:hypothetical protein